MAATERQASPPQQYKQDLARSMGVLYAVAVTVAGISPIASVFIIAPVVYDAQGSGVLLSAVLAALICIGMALCYAELGAVFPIAGGEYAITARVLGRPIGFLAFVDYMVLALVGPSSLGLGTAQYLDVVWSVNQHVVGVIVILVATAVALVSIKSNAAITALFLLLQLLAVGVIVVLGFVHIHQPLSILVKPEDFSHGTAAPVSFGVIMAGVALAITVFNGYDAPMIFSEEIENPRRNVPRAVLWALLVAVLAGTLPIIATLLGTPSLKALTTSANPMSYVLDALGGKTVDDLVAVSIVLAIFNGTVIGMLSLGRIFYSSGRDRAWPGPVSGWMAYTHPTLRTPMVATAFIGIVGALLTAFFDIDDIITFAALLLVVLYGLVALSALVSRFTQRELTRPYRMPFWPLPPLLALGGCVVIVSQQALSDVGIVVAILALGAVYYALYLRPRSATHWVMLQPPDQQEDRGADQPPAGEPRARESLAEI